MSERPDRPAPSVDWRLVAGPRLILAVSGLVIVFLVPSQPDRWVHLTYTILAAHTLYAAAIYLLLHFRTSWGLRIDEYAHWLDLAWYTALITLSSGTNSIFFFGYLFAILVASFRWGFASGMRVTLASTFLFTTCGYVAAPDPPEFEGQRFLIRPVYLLTLGYIMASRGGLEHRLRRRLEFLKEVGTVSNPRFGIDRTFGTLMHRLLALYDADTCALVTRDPATGIHALRTARRDEGDIPARDAQIPDELGRLFLQFPPDLAVGYSGQGLVQTWSLPAEGFGTGERREAEAPVSRGQCEEVAVALDGASFVSALFGPRGQVSGRLFLVYRQRRRFDESDVTFLRQVIDHVFPLIENIRLVDHLASSAAQEERRKIARDIHDGVIQPYLGLRFGLSALRQRLIAKGQDPGSDVDRLIELADSGIEDLRRQVFSLKEDGAGGGSLLPAVSRFAARFSEATGIAVHVEAEAEVPVNDRVAGEAFQMIAEGLSNIRRHTHATCARVHLACRGERLVLKIDDEGTGHAASRPFTPRSISERAAALGGHADVALRADGGTSVSIEIPL